MVVVAGKLAFYVALLQSSICPEHCTVLQSVVLGSASADCGFLLQKLVKQQLVLYGMPSCLFLRASLEVFWPDYCTHQRILIDVGIAAVATTRAMVAAAVAAMAVAVASAVSIPSTAICLMQNSNQPRESDKAHEVARLRYLQGHAACLDAFIRSPSSMSKTIRSLALEAEWIIYNPVHFQAVGAAVVAVAAVATSREAMVVAAATTRAATDR